VAVIVGQRSGEGGFRLFRGCAVAYGSEKGRDHRRIEMGAGAPGNFLHTLAFGSAASVGSVGGYGVVSVCHRQDPGPQGDALSRQTEGVAVAVEPLVMVADGGQPFAEEAQPLEHSVADLGVLPAQR